MNKEEYNVDSTFATGHPCLSTRQAEHLSQFLFEDVLESGLALRRLKPGVRVKENNAGMVRSGLQIG